MAASSFHQDPGPDTKGSANISSHEVSRPGHDAWASSHCSSEVRRHGKTGDGTTVHQLLPGDGVVEVRDESAARNRRKSREFALKLQVSYRKTLLILDKSTGHCVPSGKTLSESSLVEELRLAREDQHDPCVPSVAL